MNKFKRGHLPQVASMNMNECVTTLLRGAAFFKMRPKPPIGQQFRECHTGVTSALPFPL